MQVTAQTQQPTPSKQASYGNAKAASAILGEVGNPRAHAAGHGGLLDAQNSEGGVGPATGACQVSATAAIAAPAFRVVLREASKLIALVLGLRLRLLHLRAKVCVLALQRPYALSQQGQMLAEHRRRAALVDERLHLVEQCLKQFILLRPVDTDDGSQGWQGKEGGAA